MLSIRFISFLSLFFLCSCGDTIVEDPSTSRNGNISVVVLSAATGLPVEKANVQLFGKDSKPQIMDSKNGIVYKNLPVGNNYTFLIEATGYASMICRESLYLDIFASGKDNIVVDDAVLEARLPKLGAKLQGSIAYADFSANAVSVPAAGNGEVKIRLKLDMPQNECELLEPYRKAETGLNGTYFFDSLPELANYELTALEAKIGEISYGQFIVQSDGVLGLSGDIAKTPIGIYENIASHGEFRLASAPDTVTPNGKISLKFSKSINKLRTNTGIFSITGVGYAVEVNWNGESTLEISPVGGIWKIGDVVDISNAANLHAVDGDVLVPGNLAKVEVSIGALNAVSKFWLEGMELKDSSSFDLSLGQALIFRWEKSDAATNYAIYAKCPGEINYTQILSGLTSSANSASWAYVNASQCIEQSKQASFFVQARNAKQTANSRFIYVTGL